MKNQKTKFKQTEIGKIPEDWDVEEINNCLDKIIDYRGKTPKKSKKGIRTLSAKSIKKGTIDYSQTYFISEKTFKEWEKRGKPKIGDIIITTEGPLGKIAQYNKENVALAQRLITIRGKENTLDNSFLKYYLISPIGQHQLYSRATGTTVQGIKQSEFREIFVILPPLSEQKPIAKILSSLDAKIELNNKINKTLEAIGQVLFKRWFVDERKEEWEERKLGDYVDAIKGCSYKSEDLQESDSALVTLKSVNRGGGLNQEGYKEYVGEYKTEQLLQDGDIIVAQTDLTQKAEVIGTPAIVNFIDRYKNLIASLDLQIVRPKERLTRSFVYYLLKTEEFHNHALSYTNGTTVLHLNKDAVPMFEFLVPDQDMLKKFNSIVRNILLKIKINNKEIDRLSKIRDLLLPKLMSGEIRVK